MSRVQNPERERPLHGASAFVWLLSSSLNAHAGPERHRPGQLAQVDNSVVLRYVKKPRIRKIRASCSAPRGRPVSRLPSPMQRIAENVPCGASAAALSVGASEVVHEPLEVVEQE